MAHECDVSKHGRRSEVSKEELGDMVRILAALVLTRGNYIEDLEQQVARNVVPVIVPNPSLKAEDLQAVPETTLGWQHKQYNTTSNASSRTTVSVKPNSQSKPPVLR